MQESQFNPMRRCMVCTAHDAVLSFRLLDMCFDCALDGLEPVEPGYGVALELLAEGYDYGHSTDG